jgi:S-(hydroxymethyl)glutathione dehydrogenase/alcohol dehydrogenase
MGRLRLGCAGIRPVHAELLLGSEDRLLASSRSDVKAAVLWQRGSRLAIETAEIGPPRPGEARVRVVANAVCHSDLVQIQRETRHVPPLVLGHESAGVVESLGEGVTRVRPGDRVSIAFGVHCGECFYCLRRQSHLCESATPVWSHLRSRGQLLKPLYGVGGFAEYANVDARNLVVVPEAVPMVCAALISCGVATGVGAVLNSARVEAGASIAVIGVGGVGINVVQAARLVGAARVIAVDLIDQKLEWAREFGATHAVNASRCDPVRAIRELTEGRGVDYAFEALLSCGKVLNAFLYIM